MRALSSRLVREGKLDWQLLPFELNLHDFPFCFSLEVAACQFSILMKRPGRCWLHQDEECLSLLVANGHKWKT